MEDEEIDPEEIYVIWNSKTKRLVMATFDEDLANKLIERYVEGLQKTTVSLYENLEDYLDDNADEIAKEAIAKLTPIEYEAIKRNIEYDYPEYPEFDVEARMLYE